MKEGDIVYGPYPFSGIKDRKRMNHYCFVLEVEEETMRMKVCPGTSSHLDSCPQKHEFQVTSPKELENLGLKKPTRFDMSRWELVSIADFQYHSAVSKCPSLLGRLHNILIWCRHI